MKRQCSSKCSMLTLLKLCSVPPDEFPISSLKKQFANMIHIYHVYLWASLVAQMVKNLPAMQGEIPGSGLWVRKIPWRREWQPTPVFLPGELHGQRSLAGYSP